MSKGCVICHHSVVNGTESTTRLFITACQPHKHTTHRLPFMTLLCSKSCPYNIITWFDHIITWFDLIILLPWLLIKLTKTNHQIFTMAADIFSLMVIKRYNCIISIRNWFSELSHRQYVLTRKAYRLICLIIDKGKAQIRGNHINLHAMDKLNYNSES